MYKTLCQTTVYVEAKTDNEQINRFVWNFCYETVSPDWCFGEAS